MISQRLLDSLHATNLDLNPDIYNIISILRTQTDISRADGWSRYSIPFETLMPKGITKYMYDRGYSLCILNN
jgi:hypothetical protein